MAVRTIECTECGTTVPYGRLSCPSCGELLASVAGSARRLTSVAEVQPDIEPEPALWPEPEPDVRPEPMAEQEPKPSVLHQVAPTVALEDADADLGWDADADERAVPQVAGDLGPLTWPTVRSDPPTTPGAEAGHGDAASATPAWTTPPFPPQPSITVAPPAETPGAYVPPAPVTAATAPSGPFAGGILPAGPPAPARSWAGAADARDDAAARTGSELSLTDPARRAEAIDWIAVAGAALGSVGFLLPWARTIIGADGVGYLDTWGLAGPGHVLVVAAMLVVLALGVAKIRVPAWLRLGLPGLALSALLVGLLWPYILGPLGPLPGAYLSLAGALILGAAAIAALAMDRHARTDLSV